MPLHRPRRLGDRACRRRATDDRCRSAAASTHSSGSPPGGTLIQHLQRRAVPAPLSGSGSTSSSWADSPAAQPSSASVTAQSRS